MQPANNGALQVGRRGSFVLSRPGRRVDAHPRSYEGFSRFPAENTGSPNKSFLPRIFAAFSFVTLAAGRGTPSTKSRGVERRTAIISVIVNRRREGKKGKKKRGPMHTTGPIKLIIPNARARVFLCIFATFVEGKSAA